MENDPTKSINENNCDEMNSGYETIQSNFITEFKSKYNNLFNKYASFNKAIELFDNYELKENDKFFFDETTFTDGNKAPVNGSAIKISPNEGRDTVAIVTCYKDIQYSYNISDVTIDEKSYDLSFYYDKTKRTENEVKGYIGIADESN